MDSFLSEKRSRHGETTMDHLPDEIIHGIFNLLDKNSIKNCCAVNKRFASIIESSSVLLGNFKLQLNDEVWQSEMKTQQVQRVQRKLPTIEIADVDGNHVVLTKVFGNIGSTLRSFILSNSKIDDFTLREILRGSESLENLVLKDVTIIQKIPAIHPVNMWKLKSLTIYNCDWNIIKFIKAQLTTLDVKSYFDEREKLNLVQFIIAQCKLKELKISGTAARSLFQQDDLIRDCNYSLRKFVLEHEFGTHSDTVNWHLNAFMGLHADTLTDVVVQGPHTEQVNGFAIANLDKLNSLAVDARALPKSEEFYEVVARESNKTLKSFSIRGFFGKPESIKKILSKYPALEELELDDWGHSNSDMLPFIASHLPKLKSLKIAEITSNEHVKFAELKTFTVSFLRDSEKFKQFINLNSTLDTVKLEIVYNYQISSHFIDSITPHQHIKHIGFGGSAKSLSSILELLKTTSSSGFKTLELVLKPREKSYDFSKRTFKFYFPIDRNIHPNALKCEEEEIDEYDW